MAIKRARYFDQQFLLEADFTDEQKYHLDMRRRLNRVLHSFGIAEGLQVVKKTSKMLTVKPGVAIDSLGREMVLEADQDVDLSPITTAVPAFITIAYQERQTDPSTATGAPGNTRFTEQPTLQAVTTPPPTDGTVILLASITLAAGGTVPDGFDGGARQAAGPRGERGLVSLNNVSNPGGDVKLAPGAGITITQNQANHSITIASSGTQGLVSVDGVSNPGGNVDLVAPPGQAIVIEPDDTNNRITIRETHSAATGNVHNLTAANLQTIGVLLANDYDLRRRALATMQFTQADANNAQRTVTVGFQPRMVLVVGAFNFTGTGIGGFPGALRGYGGGVSGFADLGTALIQQCFGGSILRLSDTDWNQFAVQGPGIFLSNFFNLGTPSGVSSREKFAVVISSVSTTGLTATFTRVLEGSVGPNFDITLSLLCLG